jgi:hypothetical protein
MSVESWMPVAVCSALRAALLLTGNAALAESAALQAVSSLDPENITAQALLYKTIEISIQDGRSVDPASNDLDADWPNLPIELKSVLEMKASLRHCFVLRVLLGLPEEMCAGLLRLNRGKVGAKTYAAMKWLVIREKTNVGLTGRIEFSPRSARVPWCSPWLNNSKGVNQPF